MLKNEELSLQSSNADYWKRNRSDDLILIQNVMVVVT